MEITPPKKKLSLFWLSFFLFCLLLVAFLFQLVGPNPTIRVAKDTTYLTEDIESDGFPNYARHVIERASKGVTPENNAAVLIAQAMWPMERELKPEQYEAYSAAMGMDVPAGEKSLVGVASSDTITAIESWLIDRYRMAHEDEAEEMQLCADENGDAWPEVYFEDKDAAVYGTWGYDRPFTTQQLPPLARWAMENEAPLDQIVTASKRSHYFSMPSKYLEGESASVVALSFGLHQGSTLIGIARALSVRAMWHAGEGRHLEAWHDLKAVHAMVRLISQTGFVVDQLVANAISNMVCQVTQSLVLLDGLPETAVETICNDLDQLPDLPLLNTTVDNYDRLLCLDLVADISTGDIDGQRLIKGDNEEMLELMLSSRIDWNHVLREVNRLFSRLASVAGMKNYVNRRDAMAPIENEWSQMGVDNGRAMGASAILSSRARAQAIANSIPAFIVETVTTAQRARDRADFQLDLTRLTARLSLHRVRHGQYPDLLETLPHIEGREVPIDLFSGKALIYEKHSNGFLLYSLGPNGVDDGGTSLGGQILNGQRCEGDEYDSEIGWDDADIVILAPGRSFEVIDLKKAEFDECSEGFGADE